MSLRKVFELNRKGFNLLRGLMAIAIFLVPFIVLAAVHQEQYYLSAAFGVAMTAASDPGGRLSYRASHLALVGLIGMLLTWLAFGIGPEAWGWVALAAFAVTTLAGLVVKFGLHRFVAAYLLNIWFIIALALPVHDQLAKTSFNIWLEGLAWLAGSAAWIGYITVVWLARGRRPQPAFIPEIPGDTSLVKLTRPKVLFAVIRALAVTIAVAISFGLQLPNADWMPIAAIVAMKPSLQQAELVAVQRLAGAVLGAIVAAVFLLTVSSKYALGAVVVVFAGVAGSIRTVNYAFYTAAVAAVVLIATDIPNPSDLAAEVRRVVFTFIGVGIATAVTLLANLLQKRPAAQSTPAPPASPPRPAPASPPAP